MHSEIALNWHRLNPTKRETNQVRLDSMLVVSKFSDLIFGISRAQIEHVRSKIKPRLAQRTT